MGNVVSSLVMYALQAAWFCQRLIDQDYRQNHGSRSKPIMGVHETDLDVFLSKCRTYYLTKGSGHHRQLQSEKEESNNIKSDHVHTVETPFSGNSSSSKGADSLHFDNENFLSRTDQQLSLSHPDFSRLIIDKCDNDNFLSKSMELPRGNRKSDPPKAKRRKRKRGYYRKWRNPRRGFQGERLEVWSPRQSPSRLVRNRRGHRLGLPRRVLRFHRRRICSFAAKEEEAYAGRVSEALQDRSYCLPKSEV